MRTQLLVILCLVVMIVTIGCQAGNTHEPLATTIATSESATPRATSPSLPNFIGFVRPAPGESYTLEEYQLIAKAPSGGEFLGPGICFFAEPFWLMKSGDFPSLKELLDWFSVEIDGERLSGYQSISSWDLEGIESFDSETGELLWRTPDATPFILCYEADLEAGQHSATILVEHPSGEARIYTWEFELSN